MSDSARVRRAAALFAEGFSCSQSVFLAFAEELGLEREPALKLSQALGGGMGHLGETCGAVSGAFLAISLKHGRSRAEDLAARDRTYEKMKLLADVFRDRFGSLRCNDLLGCDLGTTEGMAEARSRDLFQTRCPLFVRLAAERTEDLL